MVVSWRGGRTEVALVGLRQPIRSTNMSVVSAGTINVFKKKKKDFQAMSQC